jgi:ubiquinone/menaquinone biosynthesis C-methylase UbiE
MIKQKITSLYIKIFGHYPSFVREVSHYYILKNLPKNPGNVLDVGCGDGILTRAIIRKKHPTRLIGIDNFSLYHKPEPSPNISYVECDLNKKISRIDDNSFDNMVCSEVLEHLEDYTETMKELYRIMKPKGRIFITIPYLRPYDTFDGHITKGYDNQMIDDMFKNSKFKKIHQEFFHRRFYYFFIRLSVGKTPILSALTFPIAWSLFLIDNALFKKAKKPIMHYGSIFLIGEK